ncbi:formyltransferase family protein [Neomegalonema perideroedes]|uniref:formyltransferase family protein n=1 Tax=Neomegalonema perideroedes TaxID=217219 RepID=UPI0004775B48|nr:formyltransferase family protein [Neomegalonema perideroedes]
MLLPEFPDRHAVEAALAAGRDVTGGTLTECYDAGPILAQRSCAILPGETAVELWRRALAPMVRRCSWRKRGL